VLQLPPQLSAKESRVRQLGVIVRTKAMVTEVRQRASSFGAASNGDSSIGDDSWAAGVKASPLGKVLAEAAGIESTARARAGRADLSVQSYPEVFVIGDLAHFSHPSDSPPLPVLPRWRCRRATTSKLICPA